MGAMTEWQLEQSGFYSTGEEERCINGNMHPVRRGFQEHDDIYHPVTHCSGRGSNRTDNTAFLTHQATCQECQAWRL